MLRDGVLPLDSVFIGVLRDGVLPLDSVFIGCVTYFTGVPFIILSCIPVISIGVWPRFANIESDKRTSASAILLLSKCGGKVVTFGLGIIRAGVLICIGVIC